MSYIAFTFTSLTNLQAQRIIKETIYRDGKPAPGVTVKAHLGGTVMTSFEGKYEVEASDNSNWKDGLMNRPKSELKKMMHVNAGDL